ncbi:MAG TPA: hypothetical protein VGB46_12135 [Flavisolibacter sp.]|jgi:hypothetical protein
MGRVIHFEGRLASGESYEKLRAIVLEFAEVHDLPVLLSGTYPGPAAELPEIWSPPLPGIFIQPGASCDSLVLEFDETLHVRSSCSTWPAGISVHILVINLLKKIEPCFSYLNVTDESGYWREGEGLKAEGKRQGIRS